MGRTFRHSDACFQGPNQDSRLGPIFSLGGLGEPIVEIPRNVLIDAAKRLPACGHATHSRNEDGQAGGRQADV